jgi:hypothetical protein
MMKFKIAFLSLVLLASICPANAQKYWADHSAAKPSTDPSTKPLTPKPGAAPHKAAPMGRASATGTGNKSGAELAQVERESVKTERPNGTAGAAKPVSIKPQPAGKTSGGNSGINATYQKPHVTQKKVK